MYDRIVAVPDLNWTDLDFAGVSIGVLHRDEATGATTLMTRMRPGAVIPKHRHSRADETVYVLEGDFIEDGRPYVPGTFFVGAAGTDHGPHETRGGCYLLTTFSADVDFLTD